MAIKLATAGASKHSDISDDIAAVHITNSSKHTEEHEERGSLGLQTHEEVKHGGIRSAAGTC